MANWYAYEGSDYGRFFRQPSAAMTQARAKGALAELKKRGATVAPVVIHGLKIASTFWGKAWCENLERYSDFSNRLPRGRTYVRRGAVLDLRIERGRIFAEVQGSRRYQVEIGVDEVPRSEWDTIVGECAGKLTSVVELLGGKLPKSVMEVVTRQGAGLFPTPQQIHLSCSCPDWADMCKHVAAVLYGVGNRLDTRPELLFALRHVDANELVGLGVKELVKAPSSRSRKLDGNLAAIFDVDIEPAPAVVPATVADDNKKGRRAAKARKRGAKSTATGLSRKDKKIARHLAGFASPPPPMPTKSKRSEEQLAPLRRALEGSSATAQFVCSGSVAPRSPIRVRFRDGATLSFERGRGRRASNALAPLLARAQPARFGHGARTLVDRRVRDGWQLNAAGGAFDVAGLDVVDIVEQVKRSLAPDETGALRAELYSINAYGPGGHFKKHKDTPRGSEMLGTLVVCLPSRHSGGALVVGHAGTEHVFDWAAAIETQREATRAHWAAFFGDVDHAVTTVKSGMRVALAYNLYRTPSGRARSATTSTAPGDFGSELSRLLADSSFMRDGGALAIPCAHMYSDVDALQRKRTSLSRAILRHLKGRDAEVARTALERDVPIELRPYLVDSCAGERRALERFPRPDEQLDDYVSESDLEEVLPLRKIDDQRAVTWVFPPPDAGDEGSELLHSCEYSEYGYFGNEGSETEFYVDAALILSIPPSSQRRQREGRR